MNLFGMLEVSGSALAAERWRAEVVSANMANAETTHTPQGGAYRRQLLVFRARPIPRFPLLLAGLKEKTTPGVQVERYGIRDVSQCQSGAGDDRLAERGPGLPAECIGGAVGEEHDPAITADLELNAGAGES